MRGAKFGVYLGILAGLAGGAGAENLPPAGPEVSGVEEPTEAGFRAWLAAFEPRALAAGISQDTLDAAFADVSLNLSVIDKDRNQNEFTKQIWDYLDTAVSEARVQNGRAAMERRRALLDEIEARYGVEAEVVAAIWGLESAYGTFRGNIPIIEALGSLAYEGRRAGFFEAELIAALKILQAGHVRLADFKGSWAGAMGHTQFMPSSFWKFAEDLRGDGKRDIWTDDPTDALASAAAYLAKHGWKKGLPWGIEVTLPMDFPYEQSGERIKKPVSEWMALGVRDVDGRKIPIDAPASVLLPAGWQGAAFLIFDNFHVIERYNTADAYVIAVGSLSDRLRGGPPIRHGWPRQDRALSFEEKRELQALLLARGFDPQGVDGIMGPNTIQAVRLFQKSKGLVPDGYASVAVLELLRQ
ncbi:lytic murein transglycosylase [Frigidibacter sp. ROC022]|uniref:lytic murein transglycosylase n=1 Tax=Frigidibacter sp. ROC022 TaxID=2971796 RepID=UPI00215B0348|nr:lytic murein transglycosylase [Frigidibacter sp. ROC022]MCR8724795.1 lytic murein transglycosylase [Frigidibacter sp. ROC022]